MKIQCPRINRLGNQCKEYVWSPSHTKLLCHRCIKTDAGKLLQEKLQLENYYEKVVLGGGKAKTPASLPKMEPKVKEIDDEVEVEPVESEGEEEVETDDEVEVDEPQEEILKPSIALDTKYRHAIEAAIAQGEKDYEESLKPKSTLKPKASKGKKSEPEPEYLDDDLEADEGDLDDKVDDEEVDDLANLDTPGLDEKVQRYTKHAIRLGGITVEQFLRNKYGVDLPGFANTLSDEPEMQEAVNEMIKEYGTTDLAEIVDNIPPWAKLAIVTGSVAAHCYSKGKGSSVVFPLPSQVVSDDNRTEIRGDKLLAAIVPDQPTNDDSLLAPVTSQD
jgi:hypothetical protein